MKKILVILRNLLLAPFVLYLYNLIGLPLISINVFTVFVVGLLGIPGFVFLIIFRLIAF